LKLLVFTIRFLCSFLYLYIFFSLLLGYIRANGDPSGPLVVISPLHHKDASLDRYMNRYKLFHHDSHEDIKI
jgi:hypothetical protein